MNVRDCLRQAGVYAAIWPKEYGGTPPDDFDAFHDLILVRTCERLSVPLCM